MNMYVYSIFDNKAGEWSPPFFQRADVHALRVFREAVLTPDPNNMLRNHPKDFTLYKVGEWNTETGILSPKQQFQLVNAQKIINEVQEETNGRENK